MHCTCFAVVAMLMLVGAWRVAQQEMLRQSDDRNQNALKFTFSI